MITLIDAPTNKHEKEQDSLSLVFRDAGSLECSTTELVQKKIAITAFSKLNHLELPWTISLLKTLADRLP
jgi:hypothetical protein